jgi:hypothetical protein
LQDFLLLYSVDLVSHPPSLPLPSFFHNFHGQIHSFPAQKLGAFESEEYAGMEGDDWALGQPRIFII